MSQDQAERPDNNGGEAAAWDGVMTRARRGDREAIGDVVDQCRGYLMAIAHGELDETIRGKIGVSDVVQETLLRAQKKLPDFRGESRNQLFGWVRKILLHHIADVRKAYRGTDKRRVDREVALNHIMDASGDALVQLAVDTATPGRGAVAAEELAKLKAAISSLSDEQRMVLTLRTWERLPFAEVGQRMGRSPDSARMLWSRAVKELTRQLNIEHS